MPDYYQHEDDGAIHTRFSDLVRCTEKSVLTVARELLYGRSNYSSDIIEFGKVRHEMWQKESDVTGKTPQVFKDELGFEMNIDVIEKEFSCTIFPGVVLHSTLDAGSMADGVIIDYKTGTLGADEEKSRHHFKQTYSRSRQHLTYGLQFLAKGIVPKKAVYLGEYWNKERTELLGYEIVEIPFDITDIVEFKNSWLKDRCERLIVALDYFRNNQG